MNSKNGIQNFISAVKEKNVELSQQHLILCILVIAISQIFYTLIFAFNNLDETVVLFSATASLFWVLFIYVAIRFHYHTIFSIIYVVVFNFIYIPSLYFITNGIFFEICLYFCVGIMVTFFLIWEKYVYCFVGIEVIWYIFILLFSGNNNNLIFDEKLLEMSNLNYAISFVIAVAFPITIIIFQSYSYNRIRNKSNEYRNSIEDARMNRSRFLSNMTNEIRTPMNAIMGMNELILKESNDPVSLELAENLKESSTQLLKILNNILEFSKLDSNNMELFPQRYNFRDLISGVIDAVASEYVDNASGFNVCLDPHVPTYLFGDSVRVRQVFMYLLFSAVKRSSHSRVSLDIKSHRNLNDNTVVFECTISESGEGLSKIEIASLLSAYSRYDSRLRSDYNGMALELSICNEILHKMGGKLEVSSVENVGTSFSFSFKNYIMSCEDIAGIYLQEEPSVLIYLDKPEQQSVWTGIFKGFNISVHYINGPNAFKKELERKKYSNIFLPYSFYEILKETLVSLKCEEFTYVIAERTNVFLDYGQCKIIRYPIYCLNVFDAINGKWEEDKYRIIARKESVIYPKAKVLIVDDSAVNLRVLKGMLKSFGIVADMARDAEETYVNINKKLYDLIILDQFMPGVDGIELIHSIREMSNKNNKVPIICATADFGPEVGRRLIAEGFQDYLAKPIQQFYLERMLRKYIPVEYAENPPEEVKKIEIQTTKEENTIDPLEVDFNKGIETVGGDQKVYCTILNTYYREGMKKKNDVKAEYSLEDLSLFVVDVHALKSSSASIGAIGISPLFKALEFAGRDKQRDFINNNVEQTLINFEIVLSKIKEYLVNNEMFEGESNTLVNNMELEVLTVEQVLEMQDAINKINLKKCEEIINDFSARNFGAKVNELVVAIKTSFEMFDYHKVKALISDLIDVVSK